MRSDDRPVVLSLLAAALSVLVLAATEAVCGDTGSDCPAFVKDYQAGLVGVLGFAGVIIAMIWNARQALRHADYQARLNREHADYTAQLAREQTTRQLVRDRQSTREAFVADLMRITDALKRHVDQLEKNDTPALPFSTRPIPSIYDRLADKLSLLTPPEIYHLVHAYGQVRDLPNTTIFLTNLHPKHKHDAGADFVLVVPSAFPGLLKVYRQVLHGVEQTSSVIADARRADASLTAAHAPLS